MVISFSGVDGCGKSTHARRTKRYLREKGMCAVLLEAYQFSLFLSLGRVFGLIGFKKGDSLRPGDPAKKESVAKTLLRRLSLVLDIFLFKAVILFFRLLGKDIIVCDRYLYDTLAHVVYTGRISRRQIDFFMKVIPLPGIAFLLTADSKIAMSREGAHSDIGYFRDKESIYNGLSGQVRFETVNTGGDAELSWQEIKNRLSRYMG